MESLFDDAENDAREKLRLLGWTLSTDKRWFTAPDGKVFTERQALEWLQNRGEKSA
jgi:hypothetical protein